jgi:hypothetical protein
VGTASTRKLYLSERILAAVHGTHSGNLPSLAAGPNADFIGSGYNNEVRERGGRGFFGSTAPGSAELAEDFARLVTEDAYTNRGISGGTEPAHLGVYMGAAQFENGLRSGTIRKQYINERNPPASHDVGSVRNAEGR